MEGNAYCNKLNFISFKCMGFSSDGISLRNERTKSKKNFRNTDVCWNNGNKNYIRTCDFSIAKLLTFHCQPDFLENLQPRLQIFS